MVYSGTRHWCDGWSWLHNQSMLKSCVRLLKMKSQLPKLWKRCVHFTCTLFLILMIKKLLGISSAIDSELFADREHKALLGAQLTRKFHDSLPNVDSLVSEVMSKLVSACDGMCWSGGFSHELLMCFEQTGATLTRLTSWRVFASERSMMYWRGFICVSDLILRAMGCFVSVDPSWF